MILIGGLTTLKFENANVLHVLMDFWSKWCMKITVKHVVFKWLIEMSFHCYSLYVITWYTANCQQTLLSFMPYLIKIKIIPMMKFSLLSCWHFDLRLVPKADYNAFITHILQNCLEFTRTCREVFETIKNCIEISKEFFLNR